MALTAGTRLGPYEIVSPLGAGGMGEVYLARDSRLARDVAIKVLPPHLAGTPDARARFEREARAASSLNHPNICILHDVGREGDTDFIVMERLEGETLAARLERGPLPVDDALRLGIQIADALDRAHRSGLVHRDLKPGNVMLTKGGAKLLDFGLARPSIAGTESGSLTVAPTLTTPLTAEGTIVGTFQYMAPEQLEGKEADARSDLWALGALLYEAVTGQRAFSGKSQASLIAAILERKPAPVSTASPLAPPALDRLLDACLAKDPEDRIQTAHDVKLQLQWILEGGSQAGVPAPVAARRRSRERLAWIVAGAGAVASLVLASVLLLRPTPKPVVTRFQVDTPAGQRAMTWPKISPDGRTLAFLATDSSGVQRIWLRPLDAVQAQPLPGTEGAGRPFWSPDSRQLAYVSEGKLKKIPVAGGPSVLVADTPGRFDGSWGSKDMILLDGSTAGDSLLAVPAGGGVAKPASSFDRGAFETTHAWPFFLPDGKHFVFQTDRANPKDRRSHVKLGELGSLRSWDLGPSDSRIEFAPPDYILYTIDGTLVAQRLDVGAKRLVGDPLPLTDQVLGDAAGLFSVSPGNVLVVGSGSQGGVSELVWMDRTGRQIGRAAPPNRYTNIALSPDGHQAVASITDTRTSKSDVWVLDLERNVASRLTFDPGNEDWGIWSPDGAKIAYTSDRTGTYIPYIKAASGVGVDDTLTAATGEIEGPEDWSRDGRWIATSVVHGQSGWDIYVRPADGSSPPRVFLSTPRNERDAKFSPDGRWIAYMSNETGRYEVYVRSFPSGESKWQISSDGGVDPTWTKGGREIIYRNGAGALVAVPIAADETFRAGAPKELFKPPLASSTNLNQYWDVTQDGERFLVDISGGPASEIIFTVTQNWLETLKKP